MNKVGEGKLIQDAPIGSLLAAKNLKNVLINLFRDAEVSTVQVKRGSSSSANIYVPKKHIGKLATVIIWEDR